MRIVPFCETKCDKTTSIDRFCYNLPFSVKSSVRLTVFACLLCAVIYLCRMAIKGILDNIIVNSEMLDLLAVLLRP